MDVYFHTLGCKVNQYETQAMMALFDARGDKAHLYEVGMPDIGEAVLVLNSCTVTGESDRKLRQLIRRCRRDNPQAVLVLTGCFSQAFPERAAALTDVDIVLGNAERKVLPDRVDAFLRDRRRIADVTEHGTTYEPLRISQFEGRTRAFVKIEDGCNRFCSYCIIPYARGRVRSRSLDSLREEVAALAKAGFCEVVLVGINLTAYGQDIGCTLADAVDAACAEPSILRVRLGSLEPEDMTDDLIARLKAQPKLCPQFHLSLQSGCAATLKRMRRRYDPALYRDICGKLRAAFPGCAITTDIMVGFPGEDEDEFAQSLTFAREIGFARAHVFAYSKRAGTPAATALDQVTQAEKAERSRRMIGVCEQTRDAFAESMVGQTVPVLTETGRTQDGGVCTEGYTATYVPVRLCDAYPPGRLVTARLTRAEHGVCYGEAVE